MNKPHHLKVFPKKSCVVCQTEFQPKSGVHKFCSTKCKEKYNQNSGSMEVGRQYLRISGNFEKYFKRLLTAKRRGTLTVENVLEILKRQNYNCALSGVELTCQLQQGTKFMRNASFDRIEAGGEYTPDNVQLVCAALNSWRSNVSLPEFIWFCKQVAETHKEI